MQTKRHNSKLSKGLLESLQAVLMLLATIVLVIVSPAKVLAQDNYGGVTTPLGIPDSYAPPVVQVAPQVDIEKAYMVKSVYLLRFTRFISWPNFADSQEFHFGVLGDSPILAPLQKVKSKVKEITDKTSGDKLPIRVSQSDAIDDLEECHILFVGDSVTQADRSAAIERFKGTGTLVVGETTEFVERGGAIGLVMVGQSINFVVNISAVKEQGLTCSAQMLKAAYRIVDKNQAEASATVSKGYFDPTTSSVP